jgi:hypothetical protein
MPTPKSHIQLIHISTLYATSSVTGFELQVKQFNPLYPELNPICHLLALLAHHFLHISRIMDKSLTLRLLMSYIYIYIYIYIYDISHLRVNETENTVNAHEQSSKDCTETQYTWNCNEILQQIPGTNVANYTAHAEDYKLIATT